MTTRVFILALGVVTLAGASLLAQPRRGGGAPAAQRGWIFNLEEGKARARATGKPLMVVIRCEP